MTMESTERGPLVSPKMSAVEFLIYIHLPVHSLKLQSFEGRMEVARLGK